MAVFAKSGSPISACLTDINGYVIDSTSPIPVNPAESGAVNFATGQVAITGSAAHIVAARTTRRAVLVTNTHASLLLYVGSASVTTGNGQQIPPGQSLSFPTTAAVYGIGSGSLTATFVEIWD
jgi:hypothetical protein